MLRTTVTLYVCNDEIFFNIKRVVFRATHD
jgi:hypothetical protein